MGFFSRKKAEPAPSFADDIEYRGFGITGSVDGRFYVHSQDIDPHGSGSPSLEHATKQIDLFLPVKP